MIKKIPFLLLLSLLPAAALYAQGKGQMTSEFLFPAEPVHNHSSSIVELKDGRLMVTWYRGSGERTADDVTVEASFLAKNAINWTPRITIADTPGFPDTNPVLWVDPQQRLWLFWGLVIANEWHTSLLKYERADKGELPFNWGDSIILKPVNIAEKTKAVFGKIDSERARGIIAKAEDKYFSRMGWFTRTHPITLPGGRYLVPLYSDGYSFGLMALSDDEGKTWFASEPIVGFGGIQPAVVVRKSGELVAYLRDNGPPPKRVQIAYSKDNGMSWTNAEDTEIPNSGTSVDVIALKDGRWLMVNNDTEKGRNSLAVSLSDDEGRTWKWTRHLEREPTGEFHYPSVMQTRDGWVHVSYSHFSGERNKQQSIKHARFNTEWVMEGDPK